MTMTSGSRLGPYEIVAPIGAGGMGEVYRARDTRLSRDVAIKLLPASVANDADTLLRFEREAEAAGTLNHPNLVTIHEFGTHDGAPFIVMELLEGQSLRKKLEEDGARLPVRKAIEYSTQIAQGLASAHEKGVVHRDLKPDNIFVTRDGRVKILDFGLAKLSTVRRENLTQANTEARQTAPGTVLGTVGYMAPEQIRGERVDHRSDLFAFGAILYEMLSGKRAFHGDSAVDTMSAILHDDPPQLGRNPNISPALDRIVRHCLEKNPEERFQSARDVAFDLETISGLSGSAPTIARKPVPRRLWLALAAACLAGIVLGITAIRLLPPRVPAGPQRTFRQLTFLSGVEGLGSLSPDGKSLVFTSDSSGNADIYLQRVDGQNAINLTKDSPVADMQPAFSPDGERIAFRSDRNGGGIFVMGVSGEAVRRLTEFGFNPAWSPDGTEIVFSNEGFENPYSRAGLANLWIVNVGRGDVRQLTKADSIQPSWSPHGHRIAFWGLVGNSGRRDIWTIAPRGSNPEKTIRSVTSDAAVDCNPVWSPDGKYLYFESDRGGTLNLWRVPIDEKSGETRGQPEPFTVPAASVRAFTIAEASDTRIAYSNMSATVSIERCDFDAVRGTISNRTPIFSGSLMPSEVQVSPDGKQIAFNTIGQSEGIFIVNSDGTDLRKITNDSARNRGPSWSSDGQTIFFYSNRGGKYDIWSMRPDGSGLRQITRTPPSIEWAQYPRQSPDGSRLSFESRSDTYVGSLAQQRFERLPQYDAQHGFFGLAWSADGDTILGAISPTTESQRATGVVTYRLSTKRYEKISDDHISGTAETVWIPNRNEILYPMKNRVVLVDVKTKLRREMTPEIPGLRNIGLSSDGRTLYLLVGHVDADLWLMTEQK
ncbi:MAG: protein kinase [Acidobacteriota bacterium]|nr:protein kinase [Acidobacteriota bacterium]